MRHSKFPPITLKLIAMLLGWGFVGLIYQTTGYWSIPSKPVHILQPGWLENRLIPFTLWLLPVYLSFFIFIPLVFMSTDTSRVHRMARTFQGVACVCLPFFVFYPTTLHYPEVHPTTWLGRWWLHLAALDTARNCLPSLHAALTAVALLAASNWRKNLWHTMLFWLWALCIMISIIAVRRHLWVDTGLGVLIGGLMWWLSARVHWRLLGERLIVRWLGRAWPSLGNLL